MHLKSAISRLLPAQAKTFFTLVRYQRIYRTSPEQWVRRQWIRRYGTNLNLEKPRTYNERLQWLKVFGEHSPDIFGNVGLARQVADKVGVREYVEAMLGSEHVVPILGVYPRPQDIPFDDLPESFVIKASHDSGSTIIVTNRRDLKDRLRDKLRVLEFRLAVNYGLLTKEWVYNWVTPQVVVEELLSSDHKTELWDYKVFVFRGEPKLIQVDVDRFGDHKRSFYTPDWTKTNLAILYEPYDGDISKPPCLTTMLDYSARLAQPFLHARVDWYVLQERLLFGEITFFPESGFGRFNDPHWERAMGKWMAWENEA
jgi:hypothetical protein